jgi:glucosylglycerate synthase
MAKVEVPEEIRQPSSGVGQAEVVIGIPGPVDLPRLQSLATALPPALGHRAGSTGDAQQAPNGPGGGPEVVPEAVPEVIPGVVVLYPCPPGVPNLTESEAEGVRFLSYDLRGATNPQLPWLGQAVAYEGLFNLAQQMQARACVVLNPDLLALTPHDIGALSVPVLSGECDLAMPLYPVARFEGLLNRAVLAPLTRALYGKRVRFPLAQDFAVSAPLMPILLQQISKSKLQGQTLLWPATEAAVRDAKICQVYLDVHHEFSAEGVDLTAILNQVVGPLFFDMERHASAWQRTRGSQETLVRGTLSREAKSDQVVDPRPMIEAFQLGHRNLQEVWSLVLPPITLLELKHLSRQPLESFSMSDQLWARVVYDFALAHRLRTLSRNHLLGALTPLYLGWVGSYVTQISNASGNGASGSETEESDGVDEGERRGERLARAFEETKPYLLQRWRWPDRFNP